VVEYANRKGMDLKEMERWLSPNLAYWGVEVLMCWSVEVLKC
jgi:hypothetical protein